MFESAEIGHAIDDDTYEARLPALREALLEAQYELKQQARFPVIVLINAGINFAIIISLFLGFLLITGRWPGMALLALIPLIALQMMFCAGLGMVLGVLNVFFRDVGQLFGICLQFWFWLTPIVYPITILPEWVQRLLQLNPLTNLFSSYQNLFLYGQWPVWSSLLPVFITGVVFCLIGLRLFRQRVGEMVDEL